MPDPFALRHVLQKGKVECPWGAVPAAWDDYCKLWEATPKTEGWQFATEVEYSDLKIPIWFSIVPRIPGKFVLAPPDGVARWLGFFDNGNSFTLYLAERHWLNYDLAPCFPNTQEWREHAADPFTFLRARQEKTYPLAPNLKLMPVRDSSGRRIHVYRLLADFWIHPSQQSKPEEAVCVDTDWTGIAVYLPELDDGRQVTSKGEVTMPESGKERKRSERLGPPFPLIGMGALKRAGLELTISYKSAKRVDGNGIAMISS